MDKSEAINKIESMIENKEDGHLTAQYYYYNLANRSGDDYDEVVSNMLSWINNRKIIE